MSMPPPHVAPKSHAVVDEEPLEALPTAPKIPASRVRTVVIVVVALLGVAFVLGYLPKRAQAAAARAESQPKTPRVLVAKAKANKATGPLTLPATVGALRETQIFARASGYVRKWYVDIGDQVTEGQLLADLDTPELDQQLAQARATLAQHKVGIDQARASAAFSKSELARYDTLAPKGVVSQQDLDTQRTRADVDRAGVSGAEALTNGDEANVHRLTDLKSFSHVTAPFAGTITMRSIENGTLVTAGTTGGRGLFTLVASDPVRVWVDVPQESVASLKPGIESVVSVREFPDRQFKGVVTRTAGALDSASRTLRTEVQVPNEDHVLLVGMYAQVTLSIPFTATSMVVPATALLLSGKGTQVAVDDGQCEVKRIPVQVERDTGSELYVRGLTGEERIIVNPGTDTLDGMTVTPVDPPPPAAPGPTVPKAG